MRECPTPWKEYSQSGEVRTQETQRRVSLRCKNTVTRWTRGCLLEFSYPSTSLLQSCLVHDVGSNLSSQTHHLQHVNIKFITRLIANIARCRVFCPTMRRECFNTPTIFDAWEPFLCLIRPCIGIVLDTRSFGHLWMKCLRSMYRPNSLCARVFTKLVLAMYILCGRRWQTQQFVTVLINLVTFGDLVLRFHNFC